MIAGDPDYFKSPAQKMVDRIMIKAQLETAGDSIISLPDLPMIVPRGKYSLDFYKDSMKLHGKTHQYKINYSDINRCFLLPLPDEIFMNYVIALTQPLR